MEGSDDREAGASRRHVPWGHRGSISGPRPREHLAHPVLADLEVAPPPQESMQARTRALAFERRQRTERLWPVWVLFLAAGLAYTAWCLTQVNAFGVMLGAHVVLGFGLLAWTPATIDGMSRWSRSLRRGG